MKSNITGLLITFLVFLHLTALSQDVEFFKSDVETLKKPWTNLDFYNDPRNFQFAIVSDNNGGSRFGIFDDAVGKLNMMMPEFVLSVGDLIQGYTEDTASIRQQWNDFNMKLEKLTMPFFYLPGNHDITNQVMQKEWEKRYGRRYYQFLYKDVLFLILDSNDDDDHNLTEEQTAFAIDAIQSHANARWIFVLMHHPIWKYDTGGRFEQIENALKGKGHTVIAGHEHTYQQIERKGTNYYVLATTGAGSALRGNRFGEFDHIVWVTMKDNGPVMTNLRLDGMLSQDIANAKTAPMAESMIANTNFKQLILTNKGELFTDGTVYLSFNNTSDEKLKVNLAFYHHHQVDIETPMKEITIAPGGKSFIDVLLKAHKPISYQELGFLQYYWKLSYEGEEYKDFYLNGNADFSIKASLPEFFKPETSQFIESADVQFKHPYDQLMTKITMNGQAASDRTKIENSADFDAVIMNNKNQQSMVFTKKYELVPYQKPVKAKNLQPGLTYDYFEGVWTSLPDFSKLKSVDHGIVTDFSVTDLAANKDNFGIRFTGYFEAPEAGMYFFRCLADDAAVLKINGMAVCGEATGELKENMQLNQSGAVALSKGMHRVEIDFVENMGNERLRLYCKHSEDSDWIFMELKDYFRTTSRNK